MSTVVYVLILMKNRLAFSGMAFWLIVNAHLFGFRFGAAVHGAHKVLGDRVGRDALGVDAFARVVKVVPGRIICESYGWNNNPMVGKHRYVSGNVLTPSQCISINSHGRTNQ